MLDKIHTALDNNARRKIFAMVSNMIDWNSAPTICEMGRQGESQRQLNEKNTTYYKFMLKIYEARSKTMVFNFTKKMLVQYKSKTELHQHRNSERN